MVKNKQPLDLSDSLEQEVEKTENKRTNSWKRLDGDKQLSESLKKAGLTDSHLDTMNVQQLENLAMGGSNDHAIMDSIELDGFQDGITGDLDALLNIGIGFKLPEVKPKYPEKYKFFWATLATNATHSVERFLATKAAVYATVNDLANGFDSVALQSAESDRIRIEEMVLLKTTVAHWERIMTDFHHNKPSNSQSEIYNRKSTGLPTPLIYNEESDAVFNPNNNSSIYGAARKVGAPKPGGWKNLVN